MPRNLAKGPGRGLNRMGAGYILMFAKAETGDPLESDRASRLLAPLIRMLISRMLKSSQIHGRGSAVRAGGLPSLRPL